MVMVRPVVTRGPLGACECIPAVMAPAWAAWAWSHSWEGEGRVAVAVPPP